MFYHARSYDPGIGRFGSADSMVPTAGSLTVTPSDAVATKAWGERGAAGNPQALNRYSYGLNNPIRNTDPTGHCVDVVSCTLEGAAIGTMVEPGGGTAVGAVVGAIAGAAIAIGVAAGIAYVASAVAKDGADTDSQPIVVSHKTQRQAQRAADRQSGAGKHGLKEPLDEEKLRDGSQAPEGKPGVRTGYRSPETGTTVHHDPYGHDYGDDTTIDSHYGVTPKAKPGVKTRTTHHTYPPRQTRSQKQ